jgi:hypothetical protein
VDLSVDILRGLGQTDIVVLPVKDGVVLPDEDISKDPELLSSTVTKTSHAAIGVLQREREIERERKTEIETERRKVSYMWPFAPRI